MKLLAAVVVVVALGAGAGVGGWYVQEWVFDVDRGDQFYEELSSIRTRYRLEMESVWQTVSKNDPERDKKIDELCAPLHEAMQREEDSLYARYNRKRPVAPLPPPF